MDHFLAAVLGLDHSGGFCCAYSGKQGDEATCDVTVVSALAFDAIDDDDEDSARKLREWNVGVCKHFPQGPKERALPTYCTTAGIELVGEAFRTGEILVFMKGHPVEMVHLSLYRNGFSVQGGDTESSFSRSWSPFSLLEKLRDGSSTEWKEYGRISSFTLSMFNAPPLDAVFHFGTIGCDADSSRESWLMDFSRAISEVTASLIPPRSLSVMPLPTVASTSTRIMAGYLLQTSGTDAASLVYCELHSHASTEAQFVIYRDAACDIEVGCIFLLAKTEVSTRDGYHCSVFGIEGKLFAARTIEERNIWLRAVSNIKVKLMFQAPEPTEHELLVYRLSIHDCIEASVPAENADAVKPPLLSCVARLPDVLEPEGDGWGLEVSSECEGNDAQPHIKELMKEENPSRRRDVL